MLKYNQKVKKILNNYASSFDPRLSNEDKDYLLQYNVMVGEIYCDHDEVCQLSLDAYKNTTKESVVNNFLYGLAYSNPIYTCTLSAYAMMINFKKHCYKSNNENQFVTCYICDTYSEKTKQEYLVAEALRLKGHTDRDLFQIYFNLSFMPQDTNREGIAIGEERLVEVLNIIKSLEKDITPNLLTKELKSKLSFKIQIKHIHFLIETLGVCGILQPTGKPSYLKEYFPRIIEKKKSHSSNWSYPVDFWLSQDGINSEAVDYWFKDHTIIIE